MSHDTLLLSLLETEWAQARLSRLEVENNLEAVKEFHQSDGWRIFYPKPIYQNRIPLYSILDAYRLTFKDILIFYGVLRNLEFYEPQSDEATPKEDIKDFIAETESIMPFLQLLDLIDIPPRKKNELRFDKLLAYQMFFGEMIILETDRDKARIYMLDNGIAQKKNAHGLLLPQERGEDNQDAATSSTGKESHTLKRQIAMWRNALEHFTIRERKVALVVIGKFNGKSHTVICNEVFGKNVADPLGKIKKLKNKAQAIADKHRLPMPEWDSRNK